MPGRLEGKRAVITGGGRGIGRAIAERFLREGAQCLIAEIVPDRLAAAAQDLSSLGIVHAVIADVADAQSVRHLFEEVDRTLGGVDVLVANAGIAEERPFLEISPQEWDRVMAVNLRGVFLCGQEAARRMIRQDRGGAIVNMSSTNGLMGERGLAHYNASKAGVMLLSKTMAIELAPYKIRVNCVNPGFIPTELTTEANLSQALTATYLEKIPLRRFGRTEDVASAFCFLASDDASFITGTELVVDGGQLAEE